MTFSAARVRPKAKDSLRSRPEAVKAEGHKGRRSLGGSGGVWGAFVRVAQLQHNKFTFTQFFQEFQGLQCLCVYQGGTGLKKHFDPKSCVFVSLDFT